VADLDGTLLALVRGEGWGGMIDHATLVRFTAAGELLDVWRDVPPPSPPEIGSKIPHIYELSSKPTWVAGAPRPGVSWSGAVLMHEWWQPYGNLARIGRDGFVDTVAIRGDATTRFGGDSHGGLYILRPGELVAVDRTLRPAWQLTAQGGPAG